MRKDGKIGMSGVDTSEGSRAFGYYGYGMKRMSHSCYRRAILSRRNAKKIGMLLVFVTAIVVVMAMAVAPSAKQSPASAIARPPPPPFPCFGQTFDNVGGLLYNCDVTVTNTRTGEFLLTTSDAVNAYFEVNLNDMPSGVWDGDLITIVATNVGVQGQNQGTVANTTGFLYKDVVLEPVVIPEFPLVILPVLGVTAMVVVASLRRRC